MFKISLFDNKKMMERFVILQIAIVMMTILISYKIAYLYTDIIEQDILFNVIYGILGLVGVVIIHELIHNILFRVFAKNAAKPSYRYHYGLISTHMPETYYKKWQYILVMLAPLVVLTSLLIVAFTFLSYSSIIFISSFHIGYCLFDLYFTIGLLNNNVKYVENTEQGIYYYTQSPVEMHTESK